jgi:hypothetical protein
VTEEIIGQVEGLETGMEESKEEVFELSVKEEPSN